MRWIQTSFHSVPECPNAAKCRTAHASNTNNRGKKTLRPLGSRCNCKVFKTFRERIPACLEIIVSISQEAGGNGGMVPVDSSEDSSTTISTSLVSPWFHSTTKDPKSRMPSGTLCEKSCSSSSRFPTPFLLGADFGDPPTT